MSWWREASYIAQQVKAGATKHDERGLDSRTHKVKGEKQLLQAALL